MDMALGQIGRDISFFIAIMATAISLGGALAHAFEIVHKMEMTRKDYFIVQTMYSGWNKLAYVLSLELAGIIAVIVLYRYDSAIMWPAVAALVFFLGSQVVFWLWTYPANAATNNWTEQPENWQRLRRQWEYSHFAGAVLQAMTMAALIVSVLRR